MEKKLGIGFPWINLDESRAAQLLTRLCKETPDVYDGWELKVARYLRPRFYSRHALIEVRIARGDEIRVRYLLDGDDAMLPLIGRSDPIHAANACERLVLNAEVLLDYLRFFVFFLRGSDGPFTLLETELELSPSDGETVTPELEELRSRIRPMRVGGQDSQGRFLVPATVAYDGTMWRATLAVSAGEGGQRRRGRPRASSRRAGFRSHRCRRQFFRARRGAARAQARATDRPGGSRRRGDAAATRLLRHPSQTAR